jgi:uncharacterized protein YraI
MRCKLKLLFALVMFPAFTGAVAAAVSTEHITFTTYLRAGPGTSYSVIDEAQTGQAVDVGKCSHGWCLVSYAGASGYVAQSTLEEFHTAPTSNRRCIVNRQAGYHGSDDVFLCAFVDAPPRRSR